MPQGIIRSNCICVFEPYFETASPLKFPTAFAYSDAHDGDLTVAPLALTPRVAAADFLGTVGPGCWGTTRGGRHLRHRATAFDFGSMGSSPTGGGSPVGYSAASSGYGQGGAAGGARFSSSSPGGPTPGSGTPAGGVASPGQAPVPSYASPPASSPYGGMSNQGAGSLYASPQASSPYSGPSNYSPQGQMGGAPRGGYPPPAPPPPMAPPPPVGAAYAAQTSSGGSWGQADYYGGRREQTPVRTLGIPMSLGTPLALFALVGAGALFYQFCVRGRLTRPRDDSDDDDDSDFDDTQQS